MGSVHVGVGHDDDLAVAQAGDVEIVLADAGTERGDHGADFFVPQHLVVAGFLHVQDLAPQRQDRLIAPVASALGGAAGRFALDQEQLAALRIALLAVGQLSGQAAGIHRALATRQIAGFASRFAGARRVDRLADDLLHHRRILVEILAQLFVDELDHVALDVGVELALGLAFELRLRQLHADHRRQALAHVVAGQVLLDVLEEIAALARGVDGAGQRAAETAQVRAAIDGVDVVGEAEYRFAVAVVVLQRDFHGQHAALGRSRSPSK